MQSEQVTYWKIALRVPASGTLVLFKLEEFVTLGAQGATLGLVVLITLLAIY